MNQLLNVKLSIKNPDLEARHLYNSIEVGPDISEFLERCKELKVKDMLSVAENVKQVFAHRKMMDEIIESFDGANLVAPDFGIDAKSILVNDCVKWCVLSALFKKNKIEHEYKERIDKYNKLWTDLPILKYKGVLINLIIREKASSLPHDEILEIHQEITKIIALPEWIQNEEACLYKYERGDAKEGEPVHHVYNSVKHNVVLILSCILQKKNSN